MNEEFKELHLRLLYRVLGHSGNVSRVGSLDYSTKQYQQVFLDSEDKVVEYGRSFNGQRNVFLSRAYRDSSGNVCGTWAITFDIDPVRPKDTAASLEQNQLALEAGRKVLQRYGGGYLANSGNGALVVYHLPSPINNLDKLKEHYQKERVLINELQELIGDKLKIDATNYSEAVIKGIGTFSTKGEIKDRRCSKWIDAPFPPFQNCGKLLERLNQISLPKQLSSQVINVAELRSKFQGDRSVADFHLVTFLKQSGVRPEDALIALKSNPLGRKEERPDDQERLITKIYGNDLDTKRDTTSSYFTELFLPKETNKFSVCTGLTSIDKTLGPLPNAELTIFSARSGFGKTSFGCTVAEYNRQKGKKVLYFSTEMSRDYLMHKLVSIHCGISLERMVQKSFSETERKSITTYGEVFEQFPVIICDDFQPTIEKVRNEVIKHKPDLLIFDHATQSGTHWEYIAQFMRGLKELVTQENIVGLVLSQLNEPPRDKSGDSGHSIRGDVRGSQEIIFLSAVFMLLNNPYQVKGNFQPVQIDIAKNRYGLSGMTVDLTVDRALGKFIDREDSHNVTDDVQ